MRTLRDLPSITLARVRSWSIWLVLLALAVSLYRCGSASADAPGVAQPREHRLSTTEMGRLLDVEVHEGQTVQRGQRLALLDTREIDAQIALARAGLERATVNVPAVSSQLDQDAFDTRRNLQGELEQARIELQTLQSGLDRERGELRALEQELQREQALLERGLVHGDHAQELQLRRSTLVEALRSQPARLEAARQHVGAAARRLQDFDRRFDSSTSDTAAHTARLRPLQADVQERRTQLAQLEHKRQQSEVVAMVDGVIQAIHVRSGDVVRPGDPLITLVERHARQVIAYVGERSGVRIAPGTPVSAHRRVALSTAPLGDTVEGVVTDVSGAVGLLPNRFWPNPQVPVYGREVYIRLSEGHAFAPGEAIDVRFGGADPASPAAPGTRTVSRSSPSTPTGQP